MPFEFLLPGVVSGNQRSFRVLHGDQERVVETVAMKTGHHLQVVGILATAEDFLDAFLQSCSDLIQGFVFGIIGRLLFSQRTLCLVMAMRFQNALGAKGVDILTIESGNNDVIHHWDTQHFPGFFE